MGLAPAIIPIRFRGGIDTKTDRKSVATTKLLVLENGVFTKAISLVKRNGYVSLVKDVLGQAAPMDGAKRLAARGAELLALNDERAYSYVNASNKWHDTGRVEAPTMRDVVVAKTGTQQGQGDSYALSGVRVAAWEDSAGGVWMSVLDDASGAAIRGPTQLDAAGTRPRVVACGALLHVYYAVAVGGFIYSVVVDPLDPTAVNAPQVMVSDLLPARPFYDAEPTSRADGACVIAWVSDLVSYRVGYVSPSGALGAPVNGFPTVATVAVANADAAIAVAWDPNTADASQRVAVATLNPIVAPGINGQISIHTHRSDTLALTDTHTIDVVALPLRLTIGWQRDSDANGFRVLWFAVEGPAATPRDHVVQIGISVMQIASHLTSILCTQRGAGLASRMFRDGSGVYVWLGHQVSLYAVAMCVRMGATAPLQCVARALPGTWAGMPARSHLPGVWDGDARWHRWTATYQDQLPAVVGNQFAESGLRVIDLDFDDVTSHQSAELGWSTYLGGAVMQQYDGARWAEAGYHYAPDEIIAVAGAGGALTPGVNPQPPSAYEYVVWYEETLATGEVDRGPTSVPIGIALDWTQNRVTLTIPTLRLTGRRNVRICVGRSQSDTPGVYNKVTSSNPANNAGSNRFIANDPTVDTVVFVDDMSDIAALAKPEVYVNGGIPGNDPLPGGSILVGGKNRLFVTDPSSPYALLYSQQRAEGYAAELVPSLRIVLDPFGGAITGLAVMDEIVVVFRESAIYFFGGDGPLAQPDFGGSWTPPILITSDVGCINGRSIAVTPGGLMFQTTKGIYLLNRGRQVSYIGAPVEGYNAQTVRSADLVANTTQIRFVCDTGKTLLYDYLFDQWSTFTNHVGLDAIMVAGVYYYLRTSGAVYREVPGRYDDNGTEIRLRLETAWIKPGEILQQYQRVWQALVLGELKSPHWFRVQHRINYDLPWSDPSEGEFDATGIADVDPWVGGWQGNWQGSGDTDVSLHTGSRYGDGNYGDGPYGGEPLGLPVFQWQLHLGQACEAIQFRFEDRQITGQPGPSFELTELLLEVGIKARTFKGALPDGRSK